ncbi:hypothetical protein L6452_16276 [Arctium lappa]|uniref:Uncharacterized protein n=1 Tax=Arctium lappa TaxID=4217 RepID=A0ACB9C096_ARCLA|nr:hypothetical protein L6452_16276 [Arctium lappa]
MVRHITLPSHVLLFNTLTTKFHKYIKGLHHHHHHHHHHQLGLFSLRKKETIKKDSIFLNLFWVFFHC